MKRGIGLLVMGVVAWMSLGALRIDSPREYQVFQRQTRLAGSMLLEGKVEGKLEYRWVGKSSAVDWRGVEVDSKTHAFRVEVSTPAGGWYRLEFRENGMAASVVEHVGMGEVFLVAGQSNSTNYGSEKQKPLSGMVASFDGTKWANADDPQPGVFDRSKGGSFIPALGDAMVKRYGVPVGVACTGAGATSVRQWLMLGEAIEVHPTLDKFVKTIGPGKWECSGELYDHFMKRVAALGPHGFRAVLWHQGESDAGQARAGYPAERQISGKQYRELLEKIIRASRKDAGWDVPWFVAQATYHSETDPADEEFRAAQKSLWEDGVALEGADTDALGKEYRAGVHFNAKGLKAHGELWAERVGVYLEKVLEGEKR
ncbi:MAG: pknB 12 [Phycisphaerales bacterium]|nr:pknB 12 [Phycisphaerales bacterium]